MPGILLTPPLLPFMPLSFASASAAALPPARLSVETLVKAIGAEMAVSTVATGIPAAIARLIGATSDLVSVGAIRIASGLRAIAGSRMGDCLAALPTGVPWQTGIIPSFVAVP